MGVDWRLIRESKSDADYEKIHPGWLKMEKAFADSGWTGAGVESFLKSRERHDPMDDDPNRDRNPK